MRSLSAAPALAAALALGCSPSPAGSGSPSSPSAGRPSASTLREILVRTKADTASLLPGPGESRSYRVSAGPAARSSSSSSAVVLKFELGEGQDREVTILKKGSQPGRQTWSLSGDSLVIKDQDEAVFEPPLPLAAPLKEGETRTGSCRGPRPDGTSGLFSYTLSTSGVEDVAIGGSAEPAQAFSVALSWQGPKSAASALLKCWWEPQKGLIKKVESIKWEGVEREAVWTLTPDASRSASR